MTTITIPTAPRAMVQQEGIDSAASSLDQILQSARRNMYPKLALLEGLASFKDGDTQRERSNDPICEARRDFLDSFAYLCDVEKGGATVTAAALQKLPYSNILWLAANEGIRPDVKAYADSILQKLKGVQTENQVEIQDDILRLAVQNCSSRLNFYKDNMQKYARNCRMQLRQVARDDIVKSLRSRLRKLSEPPPSTTLVDLVNLCYAMRGAEIKEIKRRSKEQDDDFWRLSHYLGRLGATHSKAVAVVRAMKTVPELRQISDIRTIEAPEPLEVITDRDHSSPYEIVRAICKDSTSKNPMQIRAALRAIVDLDLPIADHDKARERLTSRGSILTRVHAELQMADRFSRSKFMDFLDDDKYVGCSKPACYFCYNWLSNHKHNYILPATHNKIIPGCRGPDNGINDAGAVVLKEMYTKICGNLDQHILDFLLTHENRNANRGRQYMSTEGSSRAPSRISTVPA